LGEQNAAKKYFSKKVPIGEAQFGASKIKQKLFI